MVDGNGSPDHGQGSPAVVVSACLLGVRCTNEGGHNRNEAVVALGATHRLIPVCPETIGGLPTPRARAERRADGTVATEDGVDVTDAYARGAQHVVRVAVASGATRAVLKARSPSCGCGRIYDGAFSRTLVDGDGVTAAALREAGLEIQTEEDVECRVLGSRPVRACSSAG